MSDLESILDEWEKLKTRRETPAGEQVYTNMACIAFPRAIKALRYVLSQLDSHIIQAVTPDTLAILRGEEESDNETM